jgi:hypothetical protein
VSNLLAQIERTTRVFFKDGSWRWVNVKRFHVTGPGADRELLGALITNPSYRDYYTSPDSETPDPVHGPYELSRISIDLFVPLNKTETLEALRAWTREWAYPDRCDASWPWDIESPAPSIDGDATIVRNLVAAAATRYRLADLGPDAHHGLGWVLGEFLELVLVNRANDQLSLVVASRD